MASHKEVAKQVVDKIGGAKNVDQAWHCVTRLRFNLNDKDKVNMEEIKNIDGVMGAQFSGDQFQVIIGNHVSDVFAEVESLVGESGEGKKSGEKQNIVSLIMDFISGIFTPILPALAGAGLLKGFNALFVTVGWLSDQSDTYMVLNAIGDSVFYFLPFFLAVSTARKMRTNEYLALIVAGTLMYPTFIDAYNAIQETGKETIDFLGWGIINIPLLNYDTSVIPIILSVVLLKYVFDLVKKVIPSAIQLMFAPMITFLIVIPIALWIVGPLGTNVGNFVSDIFNWLFDYSGLFAGLLLAGFMPLIIMTGMHYAFAPIAITSMATVGYDAMVIPMMFISNVAQAGAALGVAVITRNKQMKQLGVSSSISAAIGITEPAMYGVNMKLKKPFVLAMISAGILGAFAGWYGLKAYAMAGIIGIFAIPLFADPTGESAGLIVSVILFILALVIPFILVLIFRFKDVEDSNLPTVSKPEEEKEEKTEETAAASKPTGKEIMVQSPLKGTIVPLTEVSDPTFSQEIMGKGIAIEPEENRVIAPISGSIMVFPDSKHAIGIKGDNGEEILIHIGIDTVSLKGEHFEGFIQEGDRVEVGQALVEFDREAIRDKDIPTVTMIVVTNTAEYLDVLPITEQGPIFEGEHLLTLIK
ncbi:beta-glucoside-specific PTS transporter subunit IIABC [Gracilibacillus salinarum]|uniref:Beta-glucoside-specific PTS transporter subunit IIABC n=1 Tax=Gracilibacillus salinarum TaxID=2932255 RepID=A0ABY4GMA0_9BACI|nr:beta-glucoside-specific PTS transporter subunit IIABC [Gracilibacillus salinarum]UOQ84487.1 beta-glucoside-specific PTS transporter subunit IIABC [Gracilibacillus salinarum]